MSKLLLAVAGLAVLLGVGLAIFFGLFADHGGGQISEEALAVGLYQQDTPGSSSCDDLTEIVNAPPIEELPPAVAVIEAEDVGFRIQLPNRNLASLMLARAKGGRPFASAGQALAELENEYILYVALLRQAQQGSSVPVVSEAEARAYLQAHPPGPCESGGLVRPEGVTDDELVRAIQIGETNAAFVQQAMDSSVRSGSIPSISAVDQMIADLIARARPTVEITEVAFAAAGGLVCTRDGAQVGCPSDLPTPVPTAAP